MDFTLDNCLHRRYNRLYRRMIKENYDDGHMSKLDWYLQFFNYNWEKVTLNDKCSGAFSIEFYINNIRELYIASGLNLEITNKFLERFKDESTSVWHHYTWQQWANILITNMYNNEEYNDTLYQFNNLTIDKSFNTKLIYYPGRNEFKDFSLFMRDSIYNTGLYWYHGTNHRSAKSILSQGFGNQFNMGRCDFGNGVYLYPGLKESFEWAFLKSSPFEDAAILIFTDIEYLLSKYKGLFLDENTTPTLEDVVKHYNCETINRNISCLGKLSSYIKGKPSRYYGIKNTERDFHNTDKEQLCIKSYEILSELPKHLAAIIFL